MFKVLGWILSQEGSLGQVFLTMNSFVLSSLPLALPLALFFSAIYCAGKWSGSSEYTAFRSIGFSTNKILVPIVSVSLLVGFLFSDLSKE